MSFLLFQQNLPFQTVRQFLRYWQPSSTITPETWAQRHTANLRSGDVLFFLDPIYSPWGDSTSGIGVSEGDSFKVAQACLVMKNESGTLTAIMISGDRYEMQPLEQFLAVQAAIAKSNGGGFYYAVGRTQQELDTTGEIKLAETMLRYGGAGPRGSNEMGMPDPLATFLTTLGMQLDAGFTESNLDPGHLAFMLFSDKEPPAGTKLPDMREVFAPAEGTSERDRAEAGSGESARALSGVGTPLVTNTGERPALYLELEEDDQSATMDAMPMLAKFQKRAKDGMSDEAAKDALLGAIVEAAEAAAKPPEPGAEEAPRPQIKIPVPKIPLPAAQNQAPAAPPQPGAHPVSPSGAEAGGSPTQNRQQTGTLSSLTARAISPGPPGPAVPPPPSIDDEGPPPAQPEVSPPPPRPGRLAIKIPVPPAKTEAPSAPEPQIGSMTPVPDVVSPPLAALTEDTGSYGKLDANVAPASAGSPASAWDAPGKDAEPSAPTGFNKALGSLNQGPGKFSGLDSLSRLGGATGAPPPLVPEDIFGSDEPEPPAPAAIAEAPLPAAPEPAPAASVPGAPFSVPPIPSGDSTNFTTEISRPAIDFISAAAASAADSEKPVPTISPVEPALDVSPPPTPQVKISVPQITVPAKIDPILATFGADVDDVEPPARDEPLRIEPPSSIAAVGPRKKKGEPLPLEGGSRISALKDPLNVKSGVAGLVSKLEQQATKASSRLEQQLEEICDTLNAEFSTAVAQVRDSEKASVEKTNELRTGLSERLQSAMNDVRIKIGDETVVGREAIVRFVEEGKQAVDLKNTTLTESLNESFEEVRVRAEVLARSFQETSDAQRAKAMADLKQLMESLLNQFTEANEYYSFALDGIIEHVNEQVQDRSKSTAESLRANCEHLDNQLGQVYDRARKQLDHINQDVLSRLGQSIQAAELDFVTARLDAVQTQLTPQLRLHRDTLRALISEFQSKLISDLETKGAEIIEEFAPILDDKKQQITDVIGQTSKIRESVEERQRFDADRCDMDFRAFVEDSIEDAKAKFHRTEEQIAEMDRSVRVLCDPANIEGDADLLNERESVLERMDVKTSESAQEIHESLNTSVATLEERAKQLQEELISRLEEDAYLVRKASEQALIRINTSIKEAFTSIQTAQDEQME